MKTLPPPPKVFHDGKIVTPLPPTRELWMIVIARFSRCELFPDRTTMGIGAALAYANYALKGPAGLEIVNLNDEHLDAALADIRTSVPMPTLVVLGEYLAQAIAATNNFETWP